MQEPMPNIDVNQYAKGLNSRVGEAVGLKRAVIENGDWVPQPNMCHHNVSIWCEHNPEYQPVRGWLYFALPGVSYSKFVAHSAVRTPYGELFDITPSSATQDYPFIAGDLSEDEYAQLVEAKESAKFSSQSERIDLHRRSRKAGVIPSPGVRKPIVRYGVSADAVSGPG